MHATHPTFATNRDGPTQRQYGHIPAEHTKMAKSQKANADTLNGESGNGSG